MIEHAALESFEALSGLWADRATCRQFTSEVVPRDVIETLLTFAQGTPSWCNTQPWQIDIISGKSTQRLREALIDFVTTQVQEPDLPFPLSYPGVYGERRRECGYQLYDSLGIRREDADRRVAQALRNFEFFDAPHVAIVTTEEQLGVYGAVDCGLWISSFLLGAASLGLGTAPQAALAGCAGVLHDLLGIPEGRRIVIGISFGYADPRHPVNRFRTARAVLDEVVTWHDCDDPVPVVD